MDTPKGWHLSRDQNNGCEWALFNELGDRAPRELYVELPIDPPPSPLLNSFRLISSGMIAVAVVGLIAMRRQGLAATWVHDAQSPGDRILRWCPTVELSCS